MENIKLLNKTIFACPHCGHLLFIAQIIDGEDVLYCEKCKEEIFEEELTNVKTRKVKSNSSDN